jgi:oligoribonuclease
MNPKAFYWIDVETTGLDAAEHHLLEIAICRAPFEKPFDITPIFNQVIGFADWTDVDPLVIEMHHKSGLLIDCIKSSNFIESDRHQRGTPSTLSNNIDLMLKKALDDYKSDWVSANPNEPMKSDELPVLAGSSIHFDRSFLKSDLPEISTRFSHRLYDISVLKLFCRSLGMAIQPRSETHRALADIYESIAHAQECAWWLATNNLSDLLTAHGSIENDPSLRRPLPSF